MISREKEVLVTVVDIESGTWKIAREMFEFLQEELDSKKKTVNEINIAIQEVATDIGALVKYTSNIKGKTAKLMKQTEKYKLENDEDLNEIRTALTNYQNKLMAVSGIENEREEKVPVPQQVKSVSTR
jgi:predicted  nucleic acid-binding Zn-ribbon protein